MNKEELLELLKSDEGKAIISELGYTTLNKDVVNNYLTNDNEGKSLLFSISDKAKNQGVREYKEKYLEQELEKLYNERNPQLSPEQKKIAELKSELEKRDKKDRINEVTKELLNINKESFNLPPEIVELVSSEDIEYSKDRLNSIGSAYKTTFEKHLQSAIDERVKTLGKPDGNMDNNIVKGKTISMEEFLKLDQEQRRNLPIDVLKSLM